MKHSIILKITLACSLIISNFAYSQVMRTEDDVVRYFNNATSLDLIEGIYFFRHDGKDRWNVIVYNEPTGDFIYYDMDSKTRNLKPLYNKYETHIIRTSKYAYTYYVYVVIGGYKYESGAVTFDSMHRSYHWRCDAPIDGGVHVSLNLDNKVYPK